MSGLFKKLILIFSLLLVFSCNNKKESSGKISIAVTIPPYEYLVNKIGGNKVDVFTFISVGTSPHHFEPTPKMIETASSSDYYFAVGKNMEFEDVWLQKLKDMNKNLSIIDLSKNIKYIHNDPHVWLSLQRLKMISKNIYENLTRISPSDKEFFNSNYNSMIDSISIIEKELIDSFTNIKNKKLLVYHGSWTYFANEFGLKQISIEQGSKSASAKEFKEILDEVKQSKLPVIFIDPQHSQAPAKVIAEDLNIKLDVINPLAFDLLNNFIKVKDKIVKYYK